MQGGVLIAYFVFLVLWIYAEILERRKRYVSMQFFHNQRVSWKYETFGTAINIGLT